MPRAFKPLITLLLVLSFASAITGEASEDLNGQGLDAFDAGRLDEARTAFTAAAEADSNDHFARAYLGRIALQEEHPDAAVKHLETAVELDAENSMYHTWLGTAYLAKMQTVPFMEKGRYVQRVLGHLTTATELDPENIEARTILAHYYAKAPAMGGGDLNKAREQIRIITELDQETGEALQAELLPHDK